METFKAIALPLSVVLVCAALMLPARANASSTVNAVRVAAWLIAFALAVVALVFSWDAVS